MRKIKRRTERRNNAVANHWFHDYTNETCIKCSSIFEQMMKVKDLTFCRPCFLSEFDYTANKPNNASYKLWEERKKFLEGKATPKPKRKLKRRSKTKKLNPLFDS